MVIASQVDMDVSFINTKLVKNNTIFRNHLFDLIDMYNSNMNIIIANGIKKPDVLVSVYNKEKPLLSK